MITCPTVLMDDGKFKMSFTVWQSCKASVRAAAIAHFTVVICEVEEAESTSMGKDSASSSKFRFTGRSANIVPPAPILTGEWDFTVESVQ